MKTNYNIVMNRPKYINHLERLLIYESPAARGIILQIQELTQETDSVLDVGCGMKKISRSIVCGKLTGIDIWEDYLVAGDVCGDVRELRSIFKPKSFDIVIATDLIEHLEKKDGEKLLDDMDAIGKKYIVVVTPIKFSDNRASFETPKYWSYGNQYNLHRSHWKPEEFYSRGYLPGRRNIGPDLFMVYKEIPLHRKQP